MLHLAKCETTVPGSDTFTAFKVQAASRPIPLSRPDNTTTSRCNAIQYPQLLTEGYAVSSASLELFQGVREGLVKLAMIN